MKKTVAVLLTCHNRVDNTTLCLEYLYSSYLESNLSMDVYLVDDGSTDGTTHQIRSRFPEVNIIEGNGSLYWNQGMRLAWSEASNKKDYDFYIWLNDDTFLEPTAINELFLTYEYAKSKVQTEVIITGACRSEKGMDVFTYGGRSEGGILEPNGSVQLCTYINGNIVLVPRRIFEVLGNLSNDYTHAMGDFDYGLRARSNGFYCFTTKVYIANCQINKSTPIWRDPKMDIIKRWRDFHSPRGLNISEYLIFRRKFWKYKWSIYMVKAYLRMLFPALYERLTNSWI